MSINISKDSIHNAISSLRDSYEELNRNYPQWFFLLPALLIYIPFLVVPAIGLFGLSPFQWSGLGDLKFVGLDNFANAIGNEVTYTALINNFEVGLWSIILQAGIGLLVALGINRLSDRLRQFFQVSFLLPMVVMSVGVSLVWAYMYNPAYGVINTILEFLGSNWNPLWLGDPKIALFAVIIVASWQWMGFRIILWLAGLDSIDESLIEAAKIDGASSIQRFRYIILPLLKPVALFVLIYTIVGSMNSFVYFWVMTQGGPGHATEVLVTWVYKTAFLQSNFGSAAAISVLLFIIVLVLSLLNLQLGDRSSGGGGI